MRTRRRKQVSRAPPGLTRIPKSSWNNDLSGQLPVLIGTYFGDLKAQVYTVNNTLRNQLELSRIEANYFNNNSVNLFTEGEFLCSKKWDIQEIEGNELITFLMCHFE